MRLVLSVDLRTTLRSLDCVRLSRGRGSRGRSTPAPPQRLLVRAGPSRDELEPVTDIIQTEQNSEWQTLVSAGSKLGVRVRVLQVCHDPAVAAATRDPIAPRIALTSSIITSSPPRRGSYRPP